MGQHILEECEKVTKSDVSNRWLMVKKLKVCFGCLRQGHNLTLCKKNRICNNENRMSFHNYLLNQDKNACGCK